jgi:hypothetical protein
MSDQQGPLKPGDMVRITAGEYLGAVATVRSTASDSAVVVMRGIDGTNLPTGIAKHHAERISAPPPHTKLRFDQ